MKRLVLLLVFAGSTLPAFSQGYCDEPSTEVLLGTQAFVVPDRWKVHIGRPEPVADATASLCPDAPQVQATSFHLGSASLAIIAESEPDFDLLAKSRAITFSWAASHHTWDDQPGELVDGLPFLRTNGLDGSYVLNSTRPMLFGEYVRVSCGPFGDDDYCRIRAYIGSNSGVNIQTTTSDIPIHLWPKLLMQSEILMKRISVGDYR